LQQPLSGVVRRFRHYSSARHRGVARHPRSTPHRLLTLNIHTLEHLMFFPIFLLSGAGFTVLTTEFLIVGLLPGLARDLGITVSQAGLLVTLFAFTVAAAGPLLTMAMNRTRRKTIFVGTLVLLGLANLLAAFAPNVGVMAVARFIPALALPVYWSLASATAVDIVGPEKAGKAISVITFGVICATVFGIPIGTLIADTYGWRIAFGAVSAVAFVKALMLYFYFPQMAAGTDGTSFKSQLTILRDPVMLGHVLLSVLVFTGMFTAYTYLADILGRLAGFNGQLVGWTLMAFGVVGLLGNHLGSRIVDKSPLQASLIFCGLIAAAMLALGLSIRTHAALAAVLGVWGLSQAALFMVSHVRVMKAAPQAAAFAASLNISGANLGIGLGAMLGGSVIDHFGIANLGYAGAGVMLLSLALTFILLGSRQPRQALCVN
jgi:predicted MFS family arabinose efflux permease